MRVEVRNHLLVSANGFSMIDFTIFDTLIIVLTVAVMVVVLCKTLKIPPIIGYIVVGIVSGRQIMTLLPDTQSIRKISEFGIVFLMFTIGHKKCLTVQSTLLRV